MIMPVDITIFYHTISAMLQTLRLFVEVASRRSFSEAAEFQGVTQSAASQRIRQLEKRLGVTLIDRAVRPLALTPAGEVFLEGCRDIIDRFDTLEQRVSRLRPPVEGYVRVDAIYSAGIGLLNHLKERFEREQPRVSVSVEYKPVDEVYEAVRARRCDAGIVSYPASSRDIGLIPLRDEVMAVVCGPGHPLAGRDRIEAKELADHELITFEPSLPVGRRVRRYLRENGVTPRIANSFDNIDTLKNAVALTDGLSILPTRTVLREVAAGSLAVVGLSPQLLRPIGVIYPRRGRRQNDAGPLSPAAQAFCDFLYEHAGPTVELVDEQEARGQRLVEDKV